MNVKADPKKKQMVEQKCFIAEPDMRIMLARERYDLDNPNNPTEAYLVPLPFLRFRNHPRFRRSVKIDMSHDGEHWQPAWFPHVTDGENSNCMQRGSFSFDREDLHGNITNYVVAYISTTIKEWWKPLFGPCGLDARVPPSSHGYYTSARALKIAPKPFMDAWETFSISQILWHLEDRYRAR